MIITESDFKEAINRIPLLRKLLNTPGLENLSIKESTEKLLSKFDAFENDPVSFAKYVVYYTVLNNNLFIECMTEAMQYYLDDDMVKKIFSRMNKRYNEYVSKLNSYEGEQNES